MQELNYRLNPSWELGIGTAYRSVRFRLIDNGPFPSGIGEENGVIVFLHAATQISGESTLDLYGGAVLNGELQVEDSHGHDIAQQGFDTTPMFGMTLGMHF